MTDAGHGPSVPLARLFVDDAALERERDENLDRGRQISSRTSCSPRARPAAPRGVCGPHRGIVRLVRGNDYARFGPDEVFLQLAPASFDASTFEIWGALLNGATLVLAPARPLVDRGARRADPAPRGHHAVAHVGPVRGIRRQRARAARVASSAPDGRRRAVGGARRALPAADAALPADQRLRPDGEHDVHLRAHRRAREPGSQHPHRQADRQHQPSTCSTRACSRCRTASSARPTSAATGWRAAISTTRPPRASVSWPARSRRRAALSHRRSRAPPRRR